MQHVRLLIVLAAAAALLACGLPGGFLLDDFPNLAGLGMIEERGNLAAVYLIEGVTGFPGRPLSYLTFLLQRASWPDDPGAFKVVNILLHLANGALVYALLRKLLALAGQADAAWIALLASAIWLIHPIQLSTVLYVVQRMTELATLLSLAALLAYLRGRTLAAHGATGRGYAWMSVAIALGAPLAVLAKENGALVPIFIAVLEFTLLRALPRPPRWKLWAIVFLALPPVALAAYLVFTPRWLAGFGIRDFGMVDRLYTEAVILWDYLGKILLPRPLAFGIYFDDYPVAAAPWRSLWTAAAIVGWGAALAWAIAWRATLPVLSFAILWYLAGHLLESTLLPLELYFEHRNYLPLLGPALAFAWGAKRLVDRASTGAMRRVYAVLAVSAVATLGAVTWVEARTWADPVRQAVLWAHERPFSPRAQYALGAEFMFAARYQEASEVFARAERIAPRESYFGLGRLYLGCLNDHTVLPRVDDLARALATRPLRPVVFEILDGMVTLLERGDCRRVTAGETLTLVGAVLTNPMMGGRYKWGTLYLTARLHAVEGRLDPAIHALEAADEVMPNLGVVHKQVSWLLSAQLYDDALRFIEQSRRDPRWRPWQRLLYAGTLDAWEREVREAARRTTGQKAGT